MKHKCDGCRYKGEFQDMGFAPLGVCTKTTNLLEADKAYRAEQCPYGEDTKRSYWENICELQKKQTEKGLKKYGQILEENTDMTIIERLEYLEEELIDGLMYIEHIKNGLKRGATNERVEKLR